jgi:predicted DNA binding CopG/RHH family protein
MDPTKIRTLPKELDKRNPTTKLIRIDPMDRRTKEFGVEKPSFQTIALRLPEALLEDIKELARRKETGFQTLVKNMLMDQLSVERKLDPQFRPQSLARAPLDTSPTAEQKLG